MKGIKGIQVPGQAEFLDQALDGLDLVVLIGVLHEDMPQHQPAFTGQGAEHLSGLLILEAIQTAAQGFAVQGHTGQICARLTGQSRRMGAKGLFDLIGVQTL